MTSIIYICMPIESLSRVIFNPLSDSTGNELGGFSARLGNMCDYFSFYISVDILLCHTCSLNLLLFHHLGRL